MVPNSNAQLIEDAKNQMNFQAMAEAESELECSGKSGYKICDWASMRDTFFAGLFSTCNPSSNPAWDGIFDNNSLGQSTWWFLSQSILGGAVAANDDPHYPTDGWEATGCFTEILLSDSGTGTWLLELVCADCALSATSIWVGACTNGSTTNPSGAYTRVGGTAAGPHTLNVAPTSAACCPASGDLVPVNFGAVPSRVRMKDYSASIFGNCPTCRVSPQTEWDGTFSLRCTTGPTNLLYFNAGGDCAETITMSPLSIGGFLIQSGITSDTHHRIQLSFVSGDRWEIEMFCIKDGPGSDVTVWSGSKLVGDTPQGTYVRGGTGSGPGVADGPACLTIESY
jgi:hypothetical protein